MIPSRYPLLYAALLVGLCVACGGRFTESGAGSGGASSGGVTGKGGNAGRGGSSAKAGSSSGGAPAGCYYNDLYYTEGEMFPAGDGCNGCSCESGQVGCTLIDCAERCYFNGLAYSPGDTFPAGDGCNSCSCDVSGAVACTEIGCANICTDLAAEYERTFDRAKSCNPAVSSEQCLALRPAGLQCGCSSYLNIKNEPAIDGLALISEKYVALGCANRPILCGQCAAPSAGYCSPEGRCMERALGLR